jgi:hypothetical protein
LKEQREGIKYLVHLRRVVIAVFGLAAIVYVYGSPNHECGEIIALLIEATS